MARPPGDQDVTASQSEAGVSRVADRPHSDKTVMNGDVSVNISPASIKTPAKPTTLPLGKYVTDAPPIGASTPPHSGQLVFLIINLMLFKLS